MIVVSNTSPITSLAAIERLDLLKRLYTQIIIPEAVYREMTNVPCAVPGTLEVQTSPWIQTQQVSNRNRVTELQSELDEGESEAIALALELKADRVLLDERLGKTIASRLGLTVIGILGILLIAKHRGFITDVKTPLDDLITQAGFRVKDSLYANILQSAGE